MKTLHIAPKPGLNGSTHPYWQGERAEAILAQRRTERQAQRSLKRSVRPSASSPVRAATKTLNRWKRALARRKTPEARARLTKAIASLEKDLKSGSIT